MEPMQTGLVIDDETATLTMFRLFLNAYGYSVITADSGETGLEMVREHHPGIVFTDLKMPGMDGFEVLRQIKKTAPATEVIVITGHGDMDQVVRARTSTPPILSINPSAAAPSMPHSDGRKRAWRPTGPMGSPSRWTSRQGWRSFLFATP